MDQPLYECIGGHGSYIALRQNSRREVEIDALHRTDDKAGRGSGRRLLCEALQWLQANHPGVETLTLSAVPHTDWHQNRGITAAAAQEKLHNFYTLLGFTQENPGIAYKATAAEVERRAGEELVGGDETFCITAAQIAALEVPWKSE